MESRECYPADGATHTGMSDKQQAHDLIDRLPPEQLPAVVSLLQFMLLDPVTRAAATAPPDDEPVTDEDRRRIHESRAWFASGGEGISFEQVVTDCGFTMEDIRNYKSD